MARVLEKSTVLVEPQLSELYLFESLSDFQGKKLRQKRTAIGKIMPENSWKQSRCLL